MSNKITFTEEQKQSPEFKANVNECLFQLTKIMLDDVASETRMNGEFDIAMDINAIWRDTYSKGSPPARFIQIVRQAGIDLMIEGETAFDFVSYRKESCSQSTLDSMRVFTFDLQVTPDGKLAYKVTKSTFYTFYYEVYMEATN